MTDQEEARGFLDSVSEAGSDESEPLIPPSVSPSRPKSPLAEVQSFENLFREMERLILCLPTASIKWKLSREGRHAAK